jgi:ketosteroid isomerase-like protein
VTDDRLEDFVHRWAEAIVSNDVTRMERFVTDDWVIIDQPGVGTRDQFHAVVASGELRHDTMTHEVIEARRLSPDVALLVTRGRNTGSYRGRPISAEEWTTDVLVRTPDGWRCTLTQLTPLKS